MTIPFTIGGARTVIPGVYDRFRVDDSLLTPANAGRSVLLIGESAEGVPGSQLDLSLNFFTSYQDVLDFYKSGPIVDAARQLFTAQPSQAFNGQVDRLYVFKTNATTRALKALANQYGSIVAARYGEAGNFIKSQIADAQAQVLPSLTFHYLPAPGSATVKLGINGKTPASVSLGALDLSAATGTPAQLASLAGAVTGMSASGGTSRTLLASGTSMTATLASPSAGVLTISLASGAWSTAQIKVGDLAVIPAGQDLSGAADENAGCYLVQACTSSALTLKRVSGLGSAVADFDTTAGGAITNVQLAASIGVFAKVTLTQTAAPVTGAGASLEIEVGSASNQAGAQFYQDDKVVDILSQASATVGKVSASVSGSQLTVNLSGASWSQTPKAGDVCWIAESSPLAGATKQNVGAWLVVTASFNSLKLVSCWAVTPEAVSNTSLNGDKSPVQVQAGVVTTSVAARRLNSAAERQVKVLASRTSDGASFPQTPVGGRVALEMSFWDGSTTDCTVSIDQSRHMTIDFTGGSNTDLTVNLKKYATLGDLVDYLNTIPGMAARIPDLRMKADSPAVLDMVTGMHIMSASALPAYNGRMKRDYADFKRLIDDNFSLIAFQEGTMALKAGLPAAEAAAGFLTGGEVGATSNADIQAGLDAGLKVDVRIVTPTFSRDANKDVEDGLTDESSTYSIDSVHAALQAHVATASSTLFKRERFGKASFMGSFEDSKAKAAAVAYERMQMGFQMVRATGADGTLKWFQPWMGMCAMAAGRCQAEAGTPMLRKSFNMTAVKHIGDKSVFDDTLILDFDPEDRGHLTQAIEAGLVVWGAQRGAGTVLLSPDCTTRSRDGDPQAWVWERANVLFACDEARQALRTTLENLIGRSTAELSAADVRRAADGVLRSFVTRGVLLRYAVNDVVSVGNGYNVQVDLFPPEAVEFIGIDVLAKRSA